MHLGSNPAPLRPVTLSWIKNPEWAGASFPVSQTRSLPALPSVLSGGPHGRRAGALPRDARRPTPPDSFRPRGEQEVERNPQHTAGCDQVPNPTLGTWGKVPRHPGWPSLAPISGHPPLCQVLFKHKPSAGTSTTHVTDEQTDAQGVHRSRTG